MDFKVRCIESNTDQTIQGKIYEVKNGVVMLDSKIRVNAKSLEEMNTWQSKFELVTDKPRICEILGNGEPLEVGEDFSFGNNYNLSIEQYCGSDSYSIFDNQGLEISSRLIVEMINHPEKIIRQPQFSEDEKALMRGLVVAGFPWIARDENNAPCAYKEEPSKRSSGKWDSNCEYDDKIIPTAILKQITWNDSKPFNAAEYLEELK